MDFGARLLGHHRCHRRPSDPLRVNLSHAGLDYLHFDGSRVHEFVLVLYGA